MQFSLDVVRERRPPSSTLTAGFPWLDGSGAVCAHISRDGATRFIDWPSIGLFAISDGDPWIKAWPDEGVPETNVEHFFTCRLLPLVLESRGRQVLHASAVAHGSRVIAIAGVSGSGKSTLARFFVQSGARQVADDAVVIDSTPLTPRVMALPFLAGQRVDDEEVLDLGGIAVLERNDFHQGRPLMTRVSGPAACVLLLTHAHVFDTEGSPARLVPSFAMLADKVPVHRVRYRPDLRELPLLVQTIRGLDLA